MKNNPLRVPLINSAVILSILALLVYFTVTSAEGSVWSSIGAIFLLVFRVAQLAVGLGLALVVCLGVLIGIFLGAVAIFDSTAASRMYEGLRRMILAWSAPLAGLFKSDREERLAAALVAQEEKILSEVTRRIGGLKGELGTQGSTLEGRLQELSGRLARLEDMAASRAALDEQAETLAATGERVASLEETMTKVQATLKQLAESSEVDAERILGDLPARVEALEKAEPPEMPEPVDLSPLEKELQALREEVDGLLQSLDGRTDTATAEERAVDEGDEGEEDEHRLFSYFDNPEDKKKLAELVAQTLKKDMTYAQVTDFLIQEMGEEGGKVISEHPSLAKDYIRQCRRKV